MTSTGTHLLSHLARTAREHHLFNPGDTLIVAVSGGADSTALLDLLAKLPGYNLTLVAAHLNHSLRGAESDADEEFCRTLAGNLGIPMVTARVDVRALAQREGLNLEDAGRRARIEFLDDIGRTYRATVVLAHHADDQAETFLMRLLRGSGMTGLSGMALRNARGYIRPLLEISRADIERYLLTQGLSWREDQSNSDTSYLRNRIRHELLPLLEGYNPAIRRTLASTASLISHDDALLEELTARESEVSCRTEEGRVVCSVSHLRSLHPSLRRRVLRYAIRMLAGTLTGVTLRHSRALHSMVVSPRPNSRLALPHGVAAVREYDDLIFLLHSCDEPDTGFELLISAPGSYQLPCGGSITVETVAALNRSPHSGTAYFDLAGSPFPWLVRTFRAGDRMIPSGMSGRKKVKDIFIDRKMPVSQRRTVPLLFCREHLIWVAGVCRSGPSRPDSSASSLIKVTWRSSSDT